MVHLAIRRKISGVGRKQVHQFACAALRVLRQSRKDLSLVLTSDREIRRFNRKYLRHDWPTDVLAFSLEGQGFLRRPLLGDVMISVDRARVQARQYDTTLWEEIKLYIVHGILHLLGYDDRRLKDRVRMRSKEKQILNRLKE